MNCLKMIKSGVFCAAVLVIAVFLTGTSFAKQAPLPANRPSNTIVKQAPASRLSSTIIGTAPQILRNGVLIPVTRGMELKEGDKIVTSPNSIVVLELGNGTSLRLNGGTTATLTNINSGPIAVNLTSGTVFVVTPGTTPVTIVANGQPYAVNLAGQGVTSSGSSVTTIGGPTPVPPTRPTTTTPPSNTTVVNPNVPNYTPTERAASPT